MSCDAGLVEQCAVMAVSCDVGLEFSSVQFSHSVVSDSLRPHESQPTRPPCPSQTPGVGDGQEGLACCSPQGHKESDITAQLN